MPWFIQIIANYEDIRLLQNMILAQNYSSTPSPYNSINLFEGKIQKVLFKIKTPDICDIFKISIATTQLDIGQHVCSLNYVVSQKILFCTSAFHYCLQSINYIFEAKKVTWFQQNYPFLSHFYQLILQGAPPWIYQVLALRKPFKKNVLYCRGGGGQLK